MKDPARSMPSPGRRAAAYWFIDGLEEMVFGLALLAASASALLWRTFAPHPWVNLSWVALYAEILLYFAVRRRVVDWLKARITYPRTGYAQPPEELQPAGKPLTTLSLEPGPPPKQNVTSFELKTVIVFLAFLAFGRPANGSPRWFVPVLMAALAATLYGLNRDSEHPYRWWSALVLGLTGLVFLWVDVPPLLEPLLPLLLGGAWLAALGGGTLIHYVLANPRPQASEGA